MTPQFSQCRCSACFVSVARPDLRSKFPSLFLTSTFYQYRHLPYLQPNTDRLSTEIHVMIAKKLYNDDVVDLLSLSMTSHYYSDMASLVVDFKAELELMLMRVEPSPWHQAQTSTRSLKPDDHQECLGRYINGIARLSRRLRRWATWKTMPSGVCNLVNRDLGHHWLRTAEVTTVLSEFPQMDLPDKTLSSVISEGICNLSPYDLTEGVYNRRETAAALSLLKMWHKSYWMSYNEKNRFLKISPHEPKQEIKPKKKRRRAAKEEEETEWSPPKKRTRPKRAATQSSTLRNASGRVELRRSTHHSEITNSFWLR